MGSLKWSFRYLRNAFDSALLADINKVMKHLENILFAAIHYLQEQEVNHLEVEACKAIKCAVSQRSMTIFPGNGQENMHSRTMLRCQRVFLQARYPWLSGFSVRGRLAGVFNDRLQKGGDQGMRHFRYGACLWHEQCTKKNG